MNYVMCKCGIKINLEEVINCPVCEDIIKKNRLETNRAIYLSKRRAWFKSYREKHREYFRIKQRHYLARKKAKKIGLVFHAS